MIGQPPANVFADIDGSPLVKLAWPLEPVAEQGRFAGFVMPRLPGDTWRWDALDQQAPAGKGRTIESLRFRLAALLDLADTLEGLHDAGNFVIDLQPENLFAYRPNPRAPVARAGRVALIDCDGFSIADTSGNGGRFNAEVVRLDHASPLLLNRSRRGVDMERLIGRERQQDFWAFALNAFRLLNRGLNPWDADRRSSARRSRNAFASIAELHETYAYGAQSNANYAARPNSRHRDFAPGLLDLFERTFRQAERQPTWSEWTAVLRRLLDPANRCEASADHWKLGQRCSDCGA
jgi:DNA-binding helix-hairpin-helix protein with protein kinase domain